jgi:hypothetical protein
LKRFLLRYGLLVVLLYSSGTKAAAGSVHFTNPLPLRNSFLKKIEDHRRLIAACLAFPLPTGFLGAHRIFLGTGPYIPVVYIGTLGGCLGVIPLTDFFAILFTKDLDRYMNNPKVFMWLKGVTP